MKLQFVVLLCAIILVPLRSMAQYSWFHDFPGNGFTGVENLSIDPKDSLSVIGNFENGITLMGTTYTGRGSFILKLTKNGTPCWHKIIRYGAGNFWGLLQVGTDAQGNTYISGMFGGTATLDGVVLSGNEFNSMIAKFDASGQLQWTKVIRLLQQIFDMDVNLAGDILLFSRHYGTVTIDNFELAAGPNAFGVLVSTDGVVQWARAFGTSLQYSTWPRACDLDESGNAYFHGLYSGTLALDGKQITSSGGNYNFFFGKFNDQGICAWLSCAERKAPEPYEIVNPPSGLVIDRGSIKADATGNLYAGGTFWQDMKIGNIGLTPQFSDPFYASSLFLLKFNSAGTIEWATVPPSTSWSNAVDKLIVRHDKVYFSGIMLGQFFFSVYSQAGEPQQDPLLFPLYGDFASGLGVDSEDSVYMSGRSNTPSSLKGFVFKYNYLPKPPPGDPGIVTMPTTVCMSDQALRFETTPIEGATSYEWEIVSNGHSFFFTSPENTVEVSTQEIPMVNDLYVRVRGKNQVGTSPYTPSHRVKVESPPIAPALQATCNAIYFVDNGSPVHWYQNDVWLSQYAETQTSIIPAVSGDYKVMVSNTCGTAESNILAYEPLSPTSLFIPNIITPDGDSFNEFFVIDSKLESPVLTIENRWGQSVYFSSSYCNDWNGGLLSSGVYFYTITDGCLSAPLKGSLTIRR